METLRFITPKKQATPAREGNGVSESKEWWVVASIAAAVLTIVAVLLGAYLIH
jgi:anti-sigma-K factor RskA